MALFPCPECGGQVSDAATVCPHCGYPLVAAAPATPALPTAAGTSADASLDALGPELAQDVRAALAQAGLGDVLKSGHVHVGPVTVGKPVVTTWTSTTAGPAVGRGMTAAEVMAAMPRMFAAATGGQAGASARVYGGGLGYDYRSKWTLLGLPLLAMSKGYDPATGRKRVAKGWVAVGDVAVGVVAVGGAAFGVVCVGGLSVGVVSLGGLAVGLVLAVGGAAVGTVAVGGAAVGLWAAGGGAFGLHVLGPTSGG